MIRLLFADDHILFRQGLHRLLSESEELEIVSECACGQEALAAIKKFQPDIVLLDISLPDIDGVTLVGMLRSEGIEIPVVMLTMHDDPAWCRRAIAAGANGYLLKDDAFNELMRAIHEVIGGNQYLSRRLLHNGFSELVTAPLLTDREIEILKLISKGKTNRKIAEELKISMKTVDTHRTRLMKKLKLHNAAELVRHAVEHGLV